MGSPCKNCTRRKVGCHDVKKCKEWKAYVEAIKREKERRQEVYEANHDRASHVMRMHPRKKPRQP